MSKLVNDRDIDKSKIFRYTDMEPYTEVWPGRVAQPVGYLTHKSEVLASIPSLATYFGFSFP